MAVRKRLICATPQLLERDQGVRFEIARAGVQRPAFAVRVDGQPRGYLNQCGHVPVELDWQPGQFFDDTRLYLICSTHGALYDPASGRCVSGRCAGRGLVPLPLAEHDGHVYLIETEHHD